MLSNEGTEAVSSEGEATEATESNVEVSGGEPVDLSSVEQEETPEGEVKEGEVKEGEYAPDYSFKFYGKDGEFEDWTRGLIKDKATEDQFRSLYAKSHGFEFLKDKYKTREAEYEGVQSQVGELESSVKERDEVLEELKYFRDTDLGQFFKLANVPVEKVVDFVEQHLNFLEKPEAEQKEISSYREHAMRARELEKENQSYQAQFEQRDLDSHVSEFEQVCEHPEVTGFIEKFDSMSGREGAFKEVVITHGEAVFNKSGETLSPLEAVRAVYRQYKPFFAAQEAQEVSPLGEPVAAAPAAPAAQERPTAIPNVGGSASTVAPPQKVFTSIDELKAHHKEMMAMGE